MLLLSLRSAIRPDSLMWEGGGRSARPPLTPRGSEPYLLRLAVLGGLPCAPVPAYARQSPLEGRCVLLGRYPLVSHRGLDTCMFRLSIFPDQLVPIRRSFREDPSHAGLQATRSAGVGLGSRASSFAMCASSSLPSNRPDRPPLNRRGGLPLAGPYKTPRPPTPNPRRPPTR